MKRIYILVLIVITLLTSGCFKRDDMEDINVITTIYPIEYVAKRLYGNSSTITTIYPRSTNIDTYKVTNKNLRDFSEYDLFIYNGESTEREYATTMLNNNKNLKIIDASYGLEATNIASDVWLNPSNMLMIAQNIKNELEGYISNPYLIDEISNEYELLKVDISRLENDFKSACDNSIDKRIISTDESLLFLEKYGFTVINLTEDGKNKDNNIELAKSLLDSKKLSYIFVHENEKENKTIDDLVTTYNIKKATFRIMPTITEEDISTNEDYLSIMNSNIATIIEETYK